MASGTLRSLGSGAFMGGMDDVIYLAVFLAFSALCYGYVHVCERIVRRDETNPTEPR